MSAQHMPLTRSNSGGSTPARVLILVCSASHAGEFERLAAQCTHTLAQQGARIEGTEVITHVALRDSDVKALVTQLAPCIVVTTGRHLMSLLLNGEDTLSTNMNGEGMPLLQDLDALHGSILPAHASWGQRRVYPLEGPLSTSPLRRAKRDSGGGGHISPSGSHSPSNSPRGSSSMGRAWPESISSDLQSLFATLASVQQRHCTEFAGLVAAHESWRNANLAALSTAVHSADMYRTGQRVAVSASNTDAADCL
jgi:hypothetical protein